jgi:hypothetical protein
MRVLVVEDTEGTSTDVVLDLMTAGHEVRRCQPLIGEVSPCVGHSGLAPLCPLESPVDLVVQVHDRVGDSTPRELGATCAAGVGIPIVNVGRTHSTLATMSASPEHLMQVVTALEATPRRRILG